MTTTKFAALAIVLVATAAVATYDEVTPETIVDEDQSVEDQSVEDQSVETVLIRVEADGKRQCRTSDAGSRFYTFAGPAYNMFQYGEYLLTSDPINDVEVRVLQVNVRQHYTATSGVSVRSGNHICRYSYVGTVSRTTKPRPTVRCSTSFTNDEAYEKSGLKYPLSQDHAPSRALLTSMYKNGPAKCDAPLTGSAWVGNMYWRLTGWQVTVFAGCVKRGDGEPAESDCTHVFQTTPIRFPWRGWYAGVGHSKLRAGEAERVGECKPFPNNQQMITQKRYRLYIHIRFQTRVPPGLEPYGMCGTASRTADYPLWTATGRGHSRTNRRDPGQSFTFKHFKFPGVVEYAYEKAKDAIDVRSHFWCEDNDDQFMSTDCEGVEHPKLGKRYWGDEPVGEKAPI